MPSNSSSNSQADDKPETSTGIDRPSSTMGSPQESLQLPHECAAVRRHLDEEDRAVHNAETCQRHFGILFSSMQPPHFHH
jgi:hypothetical protein